MAPTLTLDNPKDRGFGNPEFSRQRRAGKGGIEDFARGFVGEFGLRLRSATTAPSLSLGLLRVFLIRSPAQMARIAARRVIARMKGAEVIRAGPAINYEGKLVGSVVESFSRDIQRRAAIAINIPPASPFPALPLTLFIDPLPKVLNPFKESGYVV